MKSYPKIRISLSDNPKISAHIPSRYVLYPQLWLRWLVVDSDVTAPNNYQRGPAKVFLPKFLHFPHL